MPKWMEIAEGELGTEETPGAGNNPRVVEYLASATGATLPDATPWCAGFVNWCLRQADIEGTGSLMARSFLKWGDHLEMPRVGCIVVLRRGGDPNSGHVGFFHSRANGRVFLLGGNQGDKVSVQGFPEAVVLGYRWPQEATAALPQPTAEEHFEAHDELTESSVWYNVKRWLVKLFGGGALVGSTQASAIGKTMLANPVYIALALLGAALVALVAIELMQYRQRSKLLGVKP